MSYRKKSMTIDARFDQWQDGEISNAEMLQALTAEAQRLMLMQERVQARVLQYEEENAL